MNALGEKIQRAKKIVFFGGAGVSTGSGIPDFRGKDGLFRQAFEDEFPGLTPEMILSHSFFFLHPDAFYRFYRRYLLHPDARASLVLRGDVESILAEATEGI